MLLANDLPLGNLTTPSGRFCTSCSAALTACSVNSWGVKFPIKPCGPGSLVRRRTFCAPAH